MKVLLLLSTDQFVFPLIHYLTSEGKKYGWKTSVGSMYESTIADRIKQEKFSTPITFINLTKFQQCDQAIRKSDLVVAMVADITLLEIADSCITHRKTLISPARLTRQMALKKTLAEQNKVLLLMDCGFAPGLDHVTAKKAIDNIHSRGGKITSFQTCSGSLIGEDSMDNPWKFKLTEPASDLINFGKHNNRHLVHGRLQHIPYHRLFERSEPVTILNMKNTMVIPEGDSLYYRKIYDLTECTTVVKGKVVRKGFDHFWNFLVKLGLTDTVSKIDLCSGKSFYHFLDSLLPYSRTESLEVRLQKYSGADSEDIERLKWLGFFSDEWIETTRELTSGFILQHLLESKLLPEAHDKDCVVMKHQLEYDFREEHFKLTATLSCEGESQQESALAKVIGFTTGAAAKSVLLGNISIKGLHIPIKKEIYDPILNELEDLGIAFHIEDQKLQQVEVNATA